jgi:hypothetical protein
VEVARGSYSLKVYPRGTEEKFMTLLTLIIENLKMFQVSGF